MFEIPQLVSAGEVAVRPTLPSFLFYADEPSRAAGHVRLPWDPAPEFVAGVFAREEGALLPLRQIASAKSWLSNAHVDRTAALLPWGAEAGPKLSPVEASSRLLAHIRDAWDYVHASEDRSLALERQQVVLTVPASFDEEARELTVRAASDAGLANLTLLEEPLAALYAWIASHRQTLSSTFTDSSLVLVCDVGGGTTDFSLIRSGIEDGELAFERVAIGEHLLLGGDNLDLTLAALVERKLGEAAKLSISQRQALRRRCSAAKEALLSGTGVDAVPVTVLGSGRGVIGGGMTTELTRREVEEALAGGFLPITAAHDLPARDRRAGLRELGLPYETEPAITKHLAAFLTRAGEGGSLAQPGAVLFNGGFFTPALARQQVLDALAGWFGAPPPVLDNAKPEAAVAIGAAFYARLRQDPTMSRRLLIRAGSARAYYVGVEADAGGLPQAVCVMPRGTEEGTSLPLERAFTIMTNRPAAFTLYSSLAHDHPIGALVRLRDIEDAHRHAPLVTAFRYGKRSRSVPLRIRLAVAFTETGTLELWCESETSDHRWRLAFNLRGLESDPFDDAEDSSGPSAASAIVIDDDALTQAGRLLRDVFGPGSSASPDTLAGDLETALGHARPAWPLEAIRKLADILIEHEAGRRKGAAFEARWLNLTGFCVRPGFGSSLDSWRVSELRKVYAAGLVFPREVQTQVEWLVIWGRVGAGFTAGQQRELALRIAGQLGLGGRKGPRLNPQIERESWRLLASLERLEGGQRARFGDELVERVRKEPRNGNWLWALGRIGARDPLYGPLNAVVPPEVAGRFLERLLNLKEISHDVAASIAQIGARTGDSARDLPDEVLARAAERLQAAGFGSMAERLRAVVPTDRSDTGRIFGESLPEGLRLAGSAADSTPA